MEPDPVSGASAGAERTGVMKSLLKENPPVLHFVNFSSNRFNGPPPQLCLVAWTTPQASFLQAKICVTCGLMDLQDVMLKIVLVPILQKRRCKNKNSFGLYGYFLFTQNPQLFLQRGKVTYAWAMAHFFVTSDQETPKTNERSLNGGIDPIHLSRGSSIILWKLKIDGFLISLMRLVFALIKLPWVVNQRVNVVLIDSHAHVLCGICMFLASDLQIH